MTKAQTGQRETASLRLTTAATTTVTTPFPTQQSINFFAAVNQLAQAVNRIETYSIGHAELTTNTQPGGRSTAVGRSGEEIR